MVLLSISLVYSFAAVIATGGHNPSPYLRRYRLPQLGTGPSSYEELLSPVDNCSKMAYISALNFQKKHFQLSTPVLRRPIVNIPPPPAAVTTTPTPPPPPTATTTTPCLNGEIACTSQRSDEDELLKNDDVAQSASNTNAERKCVLLNFDVRFETAQLELRSSQLHEEYSQRVTPASSKQNYDEKLPSSASLYPSL